MNQNYTNQKKHVGQQYLGNADPKLRTKNALHYMAAKMPNANSNQENPILMLTVDEITYLQAYLEQIKANKLNKLNQINKQQNRATEIYDPVCREMPIDWRETRCQNQYATNQTMRHPAEPGSRGAASTRMGKKSGRLQ